MGRYCGPVCRLCRREGKKLHLKGVRCETAKCPLERQWRNTAPGMHSWRRRRSSSGYGTRLREKQKVKRFYGVWDRQFLVYFRMAERVRTNTGDALLTILERRLDNVTCKLGFAPSRRTARQMVGHGHIYVNGRKVNRPGFLVSLGDVISVRPSERSQKYIRAMLGDGGPSVQPWLVLDAAKLEGRVVALPTPEDASVPAPQMQLITEMCSR
jgi:small subunit ribosomal protein S4